jgi:hypothetical protein
MAPRYDYLESMVTPVRIAALLAICVGLAACTQTTEGPANPPPSSAAAAPVPPDAMTMTCEEFTKLDQPARLGVTRTILVAEGGAPGQPTPEMAEGMVNAICLTVPKQTVRGVLTGAPPP